MEDKGDIKQKMLSLILSWAVHKSQGAIINRTVVDLTKRTLQESNLNKPYDKRLLVEMQRLR